MRHSFAVAIAGLLGAVACSSRLQPVTGFAPGHLPLANNCYWLSYGDWTPPRTRKLVFPDTLHFAAEYAKSGELWANEIVPQWALVLQAHHPDGDGQVRVGYWKVDYPGPMITLNLGGGLDRVRALLVLADSGARGWAVHADDLLEQPTQDTLYGIVPRTAEVNLTEVDCRQ